MTEGIVTLKLGQRQYKFTFLKAVQQVRGRLKDVKDYYERETMSLQYDPEPITAPITRSITKVAEVLTFAQKPKESLWQEAQQQLNYANGAFLLGHCGLAEAKLKQAVLNLNMYAGMVEKYLNDLLIGAEVGLEITKFTITFLSAVFTGGATAAAGGGMAVGATISGATSGGVTLAGQYGEKWFGDRAEIELKQVFGNAVAGAAGSLIGGTLSRFFVPRLHAAKDFRKFWDMTEGEYYKMCSSGTAYNVTRLPDRIIVSPSAGLKRAFKVLSENERLKLLADFLLRQGARWVEDAIKQVVAGKAHQTMTVETFTTGVAAQVVKSSILNGFAKFLATTVARR